MTQILSVIDDHVWGSVWELNMSDLPNLDKQEGVALKQYQPIEVNVTSLSGDQLKCRTYQMLNLTGEDRCPSPQYLNIMVMGAEECGLPNEYIERLKAVEHTHTKLKELLREPGVPFRHMAPSAPSTAPLGLCVCSHNGSRPGAIPHLPCKKEANGARVAPYGS